MIKAAYFCILLVLLAGVQPGYAAPVKAYVNKFAVSTTDNRDELKSTLQTLLMSRLNSDEIQAVDSAADAGIQIWGSYFVFGTVFSIDALIKTSSGAFMDRVFVQGDTQNELIPSVELLAKHLRRAILKANPSLAGKQTAVSLPTSVEKALPTTPKREPRSKTVAASLSLPAETVTASSKATLKPSVEIKIVPEESWLSQRLPEPMTSMAIGRSNPDKGVEIFVVGESYLRFYLKAKNLQFITAVAFNPDEKIIGVDVADLDSDQIMEVYVTVLKGGVPASQVFKLENNQFTKIAENIPYALRSMALGGKERRIFAQKINSSGNFTGDVYELNKRGRDFIAEKPLQLPPFGNLYNFNRFTDAKGKQFYVVSHPDGYLMVYANDKKLLWKSRDKFGGSETLLCQSDKGETAAPVCRSYLPQRLQVSKNGDILTVRNTGLSGNGKQRHYTKSSLLSFFWNGSALQEKWRTGQRNSFLADFSYDERAKELLLLEVEPALEGQEERGSTLVGKTIN